MNRENQEGPDIGAFLVASLLHFYSGQPLQNLSGVDRSAFGLTRRISGRFFEFVDRAACGPLAKTGRFQLGPQLKDKLT